MAARISAIVMTLNEEANVEFCLRSVRSWCDEVLVVDMMSDDRTVEVARPYADQILSHERVAGFDVGRQKGLDAASGDWLFSIDADEVATPELAAWIRAFVDSDPPYELARIPRVNVFLGRRLRSTPWWPGKPRLFRKDAIVITGDLHHGLVPAPGVRVALLPKDSSISIWHFTRQSLHVLTEKTNQYTTTQARQAIEAGRGDPKPYQLFGGAIRALAVYVAKRGYRDGMAGLVYAFDRAYNRYLTRAKRWDELRAPKRQARYDAMRAKIVSGFPTPDRVEANGGGKARPRVSVRSAKHAPETTRTDG